MPKPQMRCSVCRMWFNVMAGDKVLPPHNNRVLGGSCRGSGQPPAHRRGKFDN